MIQPPAPARAHSAQRREGQRGERHGRGPCPSVSARGGGGGGGEVIVADITRESRESSRGTYVSNDDGAYRYEFFRGLITRPEQYCAIGVGYSLDLETFNGTPALHNTKRGPAFDVPEDKNTHTNTNTNTK